MIDLDNDLIVEIYPDPGRGGQHVGSPVGVKITHSPSGTIAIVQSERSQFRNREIAMDMILSAVTHPKFMR